MRPVSDGDRDLLRDIVGRRHPELLRRVSDLGQRPLSGHTLERLRLAIVDEACETPPASDAARRILELEELLAGLAAAPLPMTRRRRAR